MIERWNPYRTMRRMDELMNRLWGDMNRAEDGGAEAWAIPLDVVQEDDRVMVMASVPGVKPEDLDVTVADGVLTIKGQSSEEKTTEQGNYLMRERRVGSFFRALRLPDTIDEEKVESHLEGGVLKITFQKQEKAQPRKISVSSTSSGQMIEGQHSSTEGQQGQMEGQHQG